MKAEAPGRRHRWALPGLLLALLITYVFEIAHGLPNRDIVWGYDSNPLLPLIAAKKIFLDGWNTGWHTPYPDFHYYVLLLFIAPYMAVQGLLGHLSGLRMDAGYPYGLRDFDTIFMHIALITRFVSAAMAVGMAYWVYRIGVALHSRRAGLIGAAIAGFSPAIVYYVHVETLDVPMLFWLSAGLYCYVRAMQTLELRWCVWMSVMAAAAVATKDYAYAAFVLLPIPLIAALARQLSGSLTLVSIARACTDRRPALALLAFVVAFAITENWIWNFSGFVGHLRVAGGFDTEGQVITTSFSRVDYFSPLRLRSAATILAFVLGWAGAALAAAGVVYAALRRLPALRWLAWPAAGTYILAVVPSLPPASLIERPYLSLLIVLAVFGGIAAAALADAIGPWRRAVTAMLVALLVLNGAAMDAALASDPRYQAEDWLDAHAAAGTGVELYGLRSELPRMNRSHAHASYISAAARPGDELATPAWVAAPAVAARAPELIVVSWAFERAYTNATLAGGATYLQDFVAGLHDGRLGYVRKATFGSALSRWFGFPPRLTPDVFVYARR